MSHEISINDYLMNPADKIGRGSSGIVYRGRHRTTGSTVAIKRIDIRNLGSKMGHIWDEIQIMRSMGHPNIVQLYDVKIDLQKDYLYMVIEYCDSSDLSDYISEYTLDFSEIHQYFTQIKNGIQYLRSKGIVHRDLKPHNILIHQGSIKIGDFGLSTFQTKEGDLMNTWCGSPLYMSPEIMEFQKYTSKSDLWSLGVILYLLIYKRHPLAGCHNRQELAKKIKTTQIQYPDQPAVDPLTMDLLQSLLTKNCHQRINWDEFFGHSWFTYYTSNSPTVQSFFQSLKNQRGQTMTSSPLVRVSSQSTTNQSPSVVETIEGDFDMTQFVIEDYQKKPSSKLPRKKEPGVKQLSGTSAPAITSKELDYSPSRLNFGSIGGHISETMIEYANQTFHWIKESIDF